MGRSPTARSRSGNVWKFVATIVVIFAVVGTFVVALPLLLSLGADL